MANVLITGGSGLVGKHLSAVLLHSGHSVGHLTRRKLVVNDEIKLFLWDVGKSEIDETAIPWADHIIHLAGETVGQRWLKSTKEQILRSRVDSTKLIIKQLKNTNHQVKSFISASAIGYYGANTGEEVLSENAHSGEGFLPEVATAWEASVDGVKDYVKHVVKIRIGIVLAKDGGALTKMALPVRWGIGSPLGSGKQWMSWIHINDLCRIFLMAVEKSIQGVYNAVAPNPVTNKDFTKKLAYQLKRPLFLPPVPEFALKMLLGEMSILVIGGNKALPIALQKEGFSFEFNTIEKALASLL
jgi:uncharacterized protein (TIGR01777 family)